LNFWVRGRIRRNWRNRRNRSPYTLSARSRLHGLGLWSASDCRLRAATLQPWQDGSEEVDGETDRQGDAVGWQEGAA
jgi:hypothetical protein